MLQRRHLDGGDVLCCFFVRRLIRASQRREGRLRHRFSPSHTVHSDVQRRLRAKSSTRQRAATTTARPQCGRVQEEVLLGEMPSSARNTKTSMFCQLVKTEADCLAASSKRNCAWSPAGWKYCYHDDVEFDEMRDESYYHDFAGGNCETVEFPHSRAACVATSGCDWFEGLVVTA